MLVTIQLLMLLLAVAAVVAIISARLKLPPAILLVVAGVALALVPGLPPMELAPELVLLLVLPPLICSSAVAMSWREFRHNLRPISLLAVGAVAFTALATAAVTHWLLGFPWAVGFVLGAIVSPPDALAPLSITRRMQRPRRILVVLEGEALANDATALVLYRFAVVAVGAGVFSFVQAAGMFAAIVAGEILWGIGVGWVMLRLRRWIADPRIEVVLSLLIPGLAYWPPEQLGGSGVLATVTAGLYISWNGLRLISAATRLQAVFFWDFLIYMIEGLVFLITGLQARAVIARIAHYPASELVFSAVAVSAVVIVARFVWMYPAAYLPHWLFAKVRQKDPSPPWQWPFVLAFTGVRGIVSLAAALAIPVVMENGEPFPERDLILFLTFCVILVTLVGQGLLLPSIIRWLGLERAGHRERVAERAEERSARQQAIEAVIGRLDELAAERHLPEDVVRRLRMQQRDRLKHVLHSKGEDDDGKHSQLHGDIDLLLIATERDEINELYRNGKIKDEVRRRVERELDLREAVLAEERAADAA